jgi:hypothetical protein
MFKRDLYKVWQEKAEKKYGFDEFVKVPFQSCNADYKMI